MGNSRYSILKYDRQEEPLELGDRYYFDIAPLRGFKGRLFVVFDLGAAVDCESLLRAEVSREDLSNLLEGRPPASSSIRPVKLEELAKKEKRRIRECLSNSNNKELKREIIARLI